MKTVEGFRLRPLGAEFIVTGEGIEHVNFNKMISLNESAAYLWREVEGKEFDVQMLADLLVQRYDVGMDRALPDSEAIAKKWIEAGIVTE
ncbi:MAG: PqqD family protein [Bacteroidales bacterium]|nr:PqqD family protein [Bacteroidales bacterium]